MREKLRRAPSSPSLAISIAGGISPRPDRPASPALLQTLAVCAEGASVFIRTMYRGEGNRASFPTTHKTRSTRPFEQHLARTQPHGQGEQAGPPGSMRRPTLSGGQLGAPTVLAQSPEGSSVLRDAEQGKIRSGTQRTYRLGETVQVDKCLRLRDVPARGEVPGRGEVLEEEGSWRTRVQQAHKESVVRASPTQK